MFDDHFTLIVRKQLLLLRVNKDLDIVLKNILTDVVHGAWAEKWEDKKKHLPFWNASMGAFG